MRFHFNDFNKYFCLEIKKCKILFKYDTNLIFKNFALFMFNHIVAIISYDGSKTKTTKFKSKLFLLNYPQQFGSMPNWLTVKFVSPNCPLPNFSA